MEMGVIGSSLGDVLHTVTQALLVPDIILLLVFAGYALFSIGSIIVELRTERRNFKVNMPKFLSSLMNASEDELPSIIRDSELLNRQKISLLTVYDYRMLPGDSLIALIRRLVSQEEGHYDRITGRNNTAAKISPMLGLMGTLIPLGPGVAALGMGDTEALSSSLLIAFDTTVAGLVVAAICLAIGKIRSNWYGDYMSSLDSAMATMLQKIENMRADGGITATEPSGFATEFVAELEKAKQEAKGDRKVPALRKGDAKAAAGAAAVVESVVGEAPAPTLDEAIAQVKSAPQAGAVDGGSAKVEEAVAAAKEAVKPLIDQAADAMAAEMAPAVEQAVAEAAQVTPEPAPEPEDLADNLFVDEAAAATEGAPKAPVADSHFVMDAEAGIDPIPTFDDEAADEQAPVPDLEEDSEPEPAPAPEPEPEPQAAPEAPKTAAPSPTLQEFWERVGFDPDKAAREREQAYGADAPGTDSADAE
ncbi:MAG: MotA/TolQ/ExbB proton channel family protein [Coriobacteriales bacterium]|jgi:biopolymer transport protein ExbB/TolQ